ncbi:NusG domain II-containing protein [Streptococcus pluranimalium]|uniref:NusG domain II-containing protein n=1 Tax=Streptococcus pluranimalium TaxID=82348 RepID=UPI003F678340
MKTNKTKIKQVLTYFKPFDYLLISLAIILSFLPAVWTIYQKMATPPSSALVAVVKIHGKVVDTYALEENGPHFEKTYHPDKGQYNIVEIDGDSIRVREDNSPDQIAVKTGWINQEGQLSICLPHDLIIEIQSTIDSSTEENKEELILPL